MTITPTELNQQYLDEVQQKQKDESLVEKKEVDNENKSIIIEPSLLERANREINVIPTADFLKKLEDKYKDNSEQETTVMEDIKYPAVDDYNSTEITNIAGMVATVNINNISPQTVQTLLK